MYVECFKNNGIDYLRLVQSNRVNYGFAKLLIFGRLLNPASKSSTVKQNENYYKPILENFNSDNVYDTLYK